MRAGSEEWAEVSLGDVCEFKYGRSLPEAARAGGSVPVFGSNGLVGVHDEPITAGPTIVIGRKGSLGEVNFSPSPCWPIDTTYYIDSTATKTDLRWLAYRISALGLNRLNRAAAVPGLNRDDAYRERLLLPPLHEQRRIAEVLDRADALRAKRRAALAQLNTLTQSIFLDLFRQAGKSVPTVSVEDGMEAIIDYRGKSPKKTERGIPLITARVVKGGELLEPNEFIPEEDYDAWMRRGLPKAGDVLFTTEAPLGEVAQLDERKVALAQRLLVLRGKHALLDNTYLKHVLAAREVRKQISARATGSTVRGIRQWELRKVMIPTPPLHLQHTFARRVAAVEKLKISHRTSLTELDALFASLQHRAFRGKL